MLKQNKELKEQRKVFDLLYKRLALFHSQLIDVYEQQNPTKAIIGVNQQNGHNDADDSDKTENLSDIYDDEYLDFDLDGNNRQQQNCELNNIENGFNKKPQQDNGLKLKLKEVNNTSGMNGKKIKFSKLCLFRKITIIIIATHRLIYFYNYNLNTCLHFRENQIKFLYSHSTASNKFSIRSISQKKGIFLFLNY